MRNLSARKMLNLEDFLHQVTSKYEEETNKKIGNINTFDWNDVLVFYGGKIITKDLSSENNYNKIIVKINENNFIVIVDNKYYESLEKNKKAILNEFIIRTLFQVLIRKEEFNKVKNNEVFIEEKDSVINIKDDNKTTCKKRVKKLKK